MPKTTAKTISPKLTKLCKWSKIEEVNERLDRGDSPNSVHKFINSNGFKIGTPLVYEYAKLRKQALVEGINVEYILRASAKNVKEQTLTPVVDPNTPQNIESMNKLKSEIDALDVLIERGYATLQSNPEIPISPSTMMTAIKLKNELTDGNHGFLTNYGMASLRDLEANKYQAFMEHLIQYIPEDVREAALDDLEEIEESYYKGTPYYNEYLHSRGDLDDIEIARRLQEVDNTPEPQGAIDGV